MGIGTVITAFVAKYVFPYGWCWPKALMFGAMLSATDPVAVVALLKEVRKCCITAVARNPCSVLSTAHFSSLVEPPVKASIAAEEV